MQHLTLTQRDIYFEGKFFGEVVNNIGGYQRYFCELDVSRFARARALLLNGNDAYQLRFTEDDGICRPVLVDDAWPALELLDFASDPDPRESARRWIQDTFEQPFEDLSTGVFRDALLKVAADEYWYFAKAHHLIMDGWGFSLQMQRFIELYDQLGREALGELQYPSFVGYASCESTYRESQAYADDRAYWLERHAAGGSRQLLPRLEGQGPEASARSRRVSISVERALFQSLGQLASTVGANITTVFHAVLFVYFSRAFRSDELVIGSPVHNRRKANEKNIIGSLVNVNACRISAGSDESFADLVRRIARDQKRDYRHSRFPIGDLVRALRERGDAPVGVLHQVTFNYQKLDFGLTVGGRPVQTHYLTHNHERLPANFVLCDYGQDQEIALHLDYNLGYFDEQGATDVLDRVQGLLQQVSADFTRAVGELSLPTQAECHRLLVEWNATDVEVAMPACIDFCFERQAAATPQAVAITWQGDTTTYSALNDQANRIAAHLLARGLQPEQLVAVYLPRKPSLVAALLGVLKAGGCYVPVDTTYPASRVGYILADSAAGIVLTDAAGAARLPAGAQCVDVDALLAGDPTAAAAGNPALGRRRADQRAYIIYTSGSTGQPKGVEIEHRSAVALIDWATRTYEPEDIRAVLAATSVCFDLSIFELFVTLAAGGRVVLVDSVLALRDGVGCDVTLVNTVPSAIRALLDAGGIPASVRCINLAGELLHQDLVDLILERRELKIYDLYGPSEDTTYSTCARRSRHGRQSIGRPIHNTRAYVLGEDGGLLPVGHSGELHLAGAGLARGYLNRPTATDERFVHNPLVNQRVYRTGDLVRHTRDGELQYLGRLDHQVKVRGYRIEPGEIEASIARQEGVESCVVVLQEDPSPGEGKMLLAYLATGTDVGGDNEALVAAVRARLAAELPAYMMPGRFACLERLPLTSNGKVDRARLPSLAPERAANGLDNDVPSTDIHKRICRLWQELLGMPVANIGESFFGFGGDSLLLVRLSARMEAEFGCRIDLPTLFENATVRAQAQLLEERLELAGLLSRLRLAEEERHSSYIEI